MMKIILFFIILMGIELHAKCSVISEAARNEYASGMFQAFTTQAYGKSALAFYQFEAWREQAKKAGENILNLIAIEKLFVWYRMYGSSLRLFYIKPTGYDHIQGEYPSRRSNSFGNYESEWGNNPEQARLIREFMLGVGEVVAGVLCATVTGGTFGYFAAGVALDGGYRIFTSLNSLWAQHQAALIALKNWEQTALKPAIQ